MSAALSLADVHTHIGRYHILQGVDFDAPAGMTTMLLGRNGAGKTTTLRTIMGLWRALGGTHRSSDRRPCKAWPRATSRVLASATPPEDHGGCSPIFPSEENLRPRRARDGPLDDARLAWIFGFFPALRKFWLSRAGALSGGQRQMLSIARAIVEPRELLLIDEPTKGLSPAIVGSLITLPQRRSRRQASRSCSSSRTFASRARSATRFASWTTAASSIAARWRRSPPTKRCKTACSASAWIRINERG